MPVRTQAARFVIFMIVVVAHVGLVALWPSARPTREALSINQNSTTLVFLPPEQLMQPRKVEPVHRTGPPTTAPGKSTVAIEESSHEESSQPATPPTDWAKAAQVAIAEQLKSDEDARRRAEGFSQRKHGNAGDDSDQAVPKPQFGWARWHTERVHTLEQGGILIHLSERCVVVVSVIAMPMCRFGKIEARGDLFDHMNDPPTPGDWK